MNKEGLNPGPLPTLWVVRRVKRAKGKKIILKKCVKKPFFLGSKKE
jgi:hypothetical protein